MKITKTQILKSELATEQKKNEKLLKMVNDAREEVAGYEQIAELHAAYIGFLLQKLGATKDNPIAITKEDVAKAMALEVRGSTDDEGFKLYIE